MSDRRAFSYATSYCLHQMHNRSQHKTPSMTKRATSPFRCWKQRFKSTPDNRSHVRLLDFDWLALYVRWTLLRAFRFAPPIVIEACPALMPASPPRSVQNCHCIPLDSHHQLPEQATDFAPASPNGSLRWALNAAKLLAVDAAATPFSAPPHCPVPRARPTKMLRPTLPASRGDTSPSTSALRNGRVRPHLWQSGYFPRLSSVFRHHAPVLLQRCLLEQKRCMPSPRAGP